MSLMEYKHRRWFRVIGYLCWVGTGVLKLLPFTAHLTTEPLAHILGAMFILGGGCAALGNYRGYWRLEVAGLWLLLGALVTFAIGILAESGVGHLSIAAFFTGAAFILTARMLGLYKYELEVGSKWREDGRDDSD